MSHAIYGQIVNLGAVLFCSSIVHLFEYIEEGMKRIQDSLKTEKSS